MRKLVEYSDGCEGIWTDYVNRSPRATIAHQIGFRKVIENGLGNKSKYLLVRDGSTVTGVLPLFEVRTWWQASYLISVPWLDYGGICADDVESERLLLEAAQKLAVRDKSTFIEFRSQDKSHLDLAEMHQKVTFLMDLAPGAEAIWKGMDSKLRNQIRKSQNSGLTVQYG
ncbi:MAG: hypothetical protein WBP29_11305, partial [Candidatus Zixiibacteriota bacterium]